MSLSADQFLGYDPSSAEWAVWVVKLPPGANSHTTPFVPKNSRHAPSALREVREFEKRNKDRETLIGQIDRKIRANNNS